MTLTRRSTLGLLAGSLAASRRGRSAEVPFQPTRESLQGYQIPEWYRDAKFGIWAHWGPQSAAEHGDWYARNMYMQGSEQYKYHVATYGHPSKFGFKDVIPTWKGDKFDPGHLLSMYKKAGAKYFVSMGVHHDNFDLWNSRHTRWNAVNMGPKRDIVGSFRQAALREGLKFGVSEHLWISYKWFAVSHGADKTGPLAGAAYDGVDPANADLYHDAACARFAQGELSWNADGIPDSWRRHWLARITDLVDQYQPDLLYTDGALPFEEYGLRLVSHHYNESARRHGGKCEAVYTSKRREDCEVGTCVLDVERGIVDKIWPAAWQTDTCVGDWHYRRGQHYKSPKTVIDMLCDIVSRNGNLLLNFPLPNSGELDAGELQILAEITDWMAVNAEGIHGTRPWKVFGEGPGTQVKAQAAFNEGARKDLTAEDIRFTTKGGKLYAFVMGSAAGEVHIHSVKQPVEQVELLGYRGAVRWRQADGGLAVSMPPAQPSRHAVTLKITFS
ncbi:MAG TPA: alpha-L-fucosidase [Bryobacteraceae bacterium]|nr:alpha-L-fucosidase [Bryobacteraceae bacterium]